MGANTDLTRERQEANRCSGSGAEMVNIGRRSLHPEEAREALVRRSRRRGRLPTWALSVACSWVSGRVDTVRGRKQPTRFFFIPEIGPRPGISGRFSHSSQPL